MPISKKMAELHKGHMWFESAGKNKGTSFYILLPKEQGKQMQLKKAA